MKHLTFYVSRKFILYFLLFRRHFYTSLKVHLAALQVFFVRKAEEFFSQSLFQSQPQKNRVSQIKFHCLGLKVVINEKPVMTEKLNELVTSSSSRILCRTMIWKLIVEVTILLAIFQNLKAIEKNLSNIIVSHIKKKSILGVGEQTSKAYKHQPETFTFNICALSIFTKVRFDPSLLEILMQCHPDQRKKLNLKESSWQSFTFLTYRPVV